MIELDVQRDHLYIVLANRVNQNKFDGLTIVAGFLQTGILGLEMVTLMNDLVAEHSAKWMRLK